MKYKTAVFDMDGTILDTLNDLMNSVNYMLNKFGYPERTYEEIRTFVGNGIRLLVERAVPLNTPAEVVEECFDCFKKHYVVNSCVLTRPYDGIIELIKELKNGGVKTVVVSNKIDSAVTDLCEKFFKNLFDYSIGEKEGLRKKPAPDPVFYALEKIGADRESAVYIGDTEIDAATARNAGIDCISVAWGFRDREVLCSLGTEYIVDKPSQISGIIFEKGE